MAKPVEVANLQQGQHAFELETKDPATLANDVVVVEITQKEVPYDQRNVISENHIALKVRAWKVDADGVVAKDAGGAPLEIPVRVESILSSALAEGKVELGNKLVEYTIAALDRAKVWLVVKRHMERVPKST